MFVDVTFHNSIPRYERIRIIIAVIVVYTSRTYLYNKTMKFYWIIFWDIFCCSFSSYAQLTKLTRCMNPSSQTNFNL